MFQKYKRMAQIFHTTKEIVEVQLE